MIIEAKNQSTIIIDIRKNAPLFTIFNLIHNVMSRLLHVAY